MKKNALVQFGHIFLFGSLLCAASAAWGQSIPLNTLTLNGNAFIDNEQHLVLTTTTSQAGSGFIPTPYALGPNSSFEVAFAYNAFSTGTPADGLAFVAQNTPSGPNFLGMGGSGLGFFTLLPDAAIAATFDYYNNAITGSPADTASIALPNGTDLVTVTPGALVYGGGGPSGRRYVWVEYSNPQKLSLVYYSATNTKPATPILATALAQDLSSQFGGQAYFGFTGGTGAFSTQQGILYMYVTVKNP